MFIMRFDMRAPSFGAASSAELYTAALDMAEWGERNGCVQIVVSEHHGSEDGYLPSPLILAAAMAGRTRSIPIQVAALVVPLHDPIRLAEDMAVLDIASGGRVSYVVAAGYRKEEFAMFGRSLGDRGPCMEESLETLRCAWTGEPFEYRGRSVRVTPAPVSPGGPGLLMGGNSRAAARRAARFGMGLVAQGLNPEIEAVYRAECARLGATPGLCINPPAETVTSAFVAEDPDRAWRELGDYLLHDARMYAAWLGESGISVSKSSASSVAELRAQAGAYRIFSCEQAVDYVRTHGLLLTQPLCGGLPPNLAWRSLELIATKVLPQVAASSPQ